MLRQVEPKILNINNVVKSDKGNFVILINSPMLGKADGPNELIGLICASINKQQVQSRWFHLKADDYALRSTNIWTRWLKYVDEIKSWRKEAEGNKQTFDESDMTLLSLHARVYKEIFCVSRLTLIKGSPTRKGFCKIHELKRIFLTRKDFLNQERMSTLRYYKNPKILTNQGIHNFPQL